MSENPEDILEEYKLGDISVAIRKTENPNKVFVNCTDGEKQMNFEARMYDYTHYFRHMNQKIRQRFKDSIT